ncbi:MAG: hypothetical protein QOF96_3156 [Actinomycetota bacterium]|nr:hypothetical protein [Actinomycetota bacterium]
MFFQITGLYFLGRREHWVAPGTARAWDGVATPGEIGPPAAGALPLGQQLRRWGALLALGGLALPGISAAAAVADDRPPVVAAGRQTATGETAPGLASPGGLPTGDAGDGTPAAAAPWEAGVVEADGKPLPSAPPPGPVPVDGVPQPAVAAPPTTTTAPPPPAPPTANPAPGETVRSTPNQSVAPPTARTGDLVPADREYLRPILIRYAQENGLPADLVMSLAWVESSWRRSVVSEVGAVGVMQLMPNTVEYVSKKLLGLKSNLDPKNPTSNVRMGAKYLRHLLDQNHGNFRQALIAYNQGLTSLKANGSYGVAERYADRVLALRPQFRTA